MDKRTNIDILFQIATNRLETQIKRIDGIDTKIGVIFGLANGIIAVLVVFITFLPHPVPLLALISVILTVVAYFITLALLYLAYRWGRWSFRPELNRLRDICTSSQYRDYPEIVKEWIADECIRSFESNSKPISNKVKLANSALKVLPVQVLFLVVSFISYLFT